LIDAIDAYRRASPSLLRPIMKQTLFGHRFSWFAEYDPLAVCWALAGPEEDDDDDEGDSYSRGGDLDEDEEDDDEDEDQAGTLWAERKLRQRH
jgi:hypothetical protein